MAPFEIQWTCGNCYSTIGVKILNDINIFGEKNVQVMPFFLNTFNFEGKYEISSVFVLGYGI
jgi:hypothetical protein